MRLESQGFILVNGRNIRDSIQAITEMMSQMTPVEVIESDEDNTLISRIENELGVRFKKQNWTITTVSKILSSIYMTCGTVNKSKISNQGIQHFTKCIKFIFAKNQGDPDGMRQNLEA